MTATVSEHRERTPQTPRSAGGGHPAPTGSPDGLAALEPLLRLDATVRADPETSRPPSPPRRPNTFRLQREEEVQRLLERRRADDISASAAADGDRRRPTELATQREERRQVHAVSRLICQATMESLAGVRPVQQLHRWMVPAVYEKVRERSTLMAHARRPSGRGHAASAGTAPPTRLSLRQIRTQPVESGVWEVSVIFTDETRTRACAMRVEAHRGRWRAVALELG
ncbi:Rv3235 family protein [Nesterenkonia suensis]